MSLLNLTSELSHRLFSCFSCVWVTLFCFFACPIIFCWWTTLASDSPLQLGLISVVCLFICLVTWLDNVSELYISYSGKLLVLLLVEYRVGCVHCHSGFPGGSDDKESACNAEDLGFIPGSGRSPGEGTGYPLQYSCLENSMGRGAWWVIVDGVAKSRIPLTFWLFLSD